MKISIKNILFVLLIIKATYCSAQQSAIQEIPGNIQKALEINVSIDKRLHIDIAKVKELPVVLTIKNKLNEDVGFETWTSNDGVSIYSVDDAGKKTTILPSLALGGPGHLSGILIKAGENGVIKSHLPIELLKKYKKLEIAICRQSLAGPFLYQVYSKPFSLEDLNK